MNDSFANYQIIHEAILRSTRECHKHCHQNSEHDNRNEASHVASTHALKVLNNIVTVSSPNRKDLTTPHGRRCCALLADEDIFSRQQMVLHTYSKICTSKNISSRNISCPQGISVKVMRSVAFIACDIQQVPGSNASDMQRKRSTKTWAKHRTTLTAKKVVYQNLSTWLARCPWAPASWASA